jgi:hypothetical protein
MRAPRLLLALLPALLAGPAAGQEIHAFLESRPEAGAVRPAPAAARGSPDEFWRAVAEFDLSGARGSAPDTEHRRFVDAFRELLEGQAGRAGAQFLALTRAAADPQLRSVAYVGLTAALEHQERWAELDTLARHLDPGGVPGTSDGASLPAWAAVLRTLPAPTYRFPREPVELPIRISPTGTPVVEVRVNGVPARFWIDTGANMTLIASSLAERAGVIPATADTLLLGGAVAHTRARPGLVRELKIGGLAVLGRSAAIVAADDLRLPVGGGEEVQIQGVLGMDVLRQVDLEIDFMHRWVRFSRPAGGRRDAGPARNLFWLGYPVVRVDQEDGRPLFFGLDTGADRTFVTAAALPDVPPAPLSRGNFVVSGFGGAATLDLQVLSRLGVRVAGHPVRFSDVPVHAERRLGFTRLDGILAADVAAGMWMRMSMSEGVLEIGVPRPLGTRARTVRPTPAW